MNNVNLNLTLPWGTIILLIISMTIVLGGSAMIAIYFGRKQADSHWAIGGHNTPLYVIVGTQYATAVGGGVLVAHIGIGYVNGWSALTYGVFMSGGVALLAIIAKWLRENEFTTVPDIFKKIYGDSKLLMALVAICSIVAPFGWICSNLVAFSKLFTTLTGIPVPVLMALFALISLAFVLPAGFTSVAWSDFIFGCTMLFVTIIASIFAMNMAGGWANIVASTPKEASSFPVGMLAVGLPTIALWSTSLFPGTLTSQVYYQRIFAVEKVSHARKSLIISGFVILTADIFASVMGLAVRTMQSGLEPEMAAGYFLTQVPTWFLAIYAGLIAAAIMSTITSALHSVVVSLTNDLYHKIINNSIDEKGLTKLSRYTTVIVLALATVIAVKFPQALALLVVTYAYSAAALLFPIFLGYFLKDKKLLNKEGAIGSMISGFVGCAVSQIIGTSIPYVIYGLIASCFGLIFISYFTKSKYAKEGV